MVERATWVWTSGGGGLPPARLAAFLLGQGVSRAFVSVPWRGPDEGVRATVSALTRAGISVAALGGDPSWAVTPQNAATWATRAHAIDFDGTHLDIEPWTLPRWRSDSRALMDRLVAAVKAVRTAVSGGVEVDLAPWLATTHPSQFTAVAAASTGVTLMAYRNRAPNILGMVADARQILERNGTRYRIGVDTLPNTDPGATFAGLTRAYLQRELATVSQQLRSSRYFSGTAIHDADHFHALRA